MNDEDFPSHSPFYTRERNDRSVHVRAKYGLSFCERDVSPLSSISFYELRVHKFDTSLGRNVGSFLSGHER